MTSKQATSRPQFFLGAVLIILIASMAVIAETMTNTTAAPGVLTPASLDDLPSPEAAVVQALAPAGTTLQRVNITNGTKPLSTPLQAINACNSATDCTTTGYLVASSAVINVTGYNCSVTDDGKVYLTCDSMYDGNGDGKCTSGESCIQFGIVGTYITRQERNSQDNWEDHDTSYTITRPAVTP